MFEIFICVFAVYGVFCALRELYLLIDRKSRASEEKNERRTKRK